MINRPTGVTVLAILLIAWGIFNIIGALFMAFWWMSLTPGSAGLEDSVAQRISLIISNILIILVPVAFIFGAVCMVLGVGLWKLKSWARILVLIGASLVVILSLISLIFGAFGAIISLAINAIIIWYLLQPNVKSAFAG